MELLPIWGKKFQIAYFYYTTNPSQISPWLGYFLYLNKQEM